MSGDYQYDFFISHASEDKDAIARPLAEQLRENGYAVWFDEYELTLGDSLRRSIEKGLALSRFGIVVLSDAFFSKEWPQKELDGLDALERDGRKVILPIWHGVESEYVSRFSPILAGRLAIETSKGLDQVVSAIEAASQKGGRAESSNSASASLSSRQAAGGELILTGGLEGLELEDHVFQDCTCHGCSEVLLSVERESKALRRFLIDHRDVSGILGDRVQEELSSSPAEIISRVSRNAFAIRVGLASAGVPTLERDVGEDLFDLHLGLFRLEKPASDILAMQAEIGSSAYACGAYAIMKDLPNLARSLLGRSNPPDVEGERQWFRYLQIESGWGPGEMLRHVLTKWGGAEYLLDLCGGEDKALSYLCQFDFLQCAHSCAAGHHITKCYPSFCAFRRHMTQPIVEKLIGTVSEGVWIPAVKAERLAGIIRQLEVAAGKCAGFERPMWEKGPWSSHRIQALLAGNGFAVT